MASARLINKLIQRALIFFSLLLILLNEVFVYYLNAKTWQPIHCKLDNCTRILFVADPQLLGKNYDTSFYSALARWDSDRYLKKNFELALAFTQPHIICFLGDLLDEGNIANAYQYHSYVRRFHKIYKVNNKIRTIHVPGDNDIGGENGEYISNSNVRRFEIEFMHEDLFDYEQHLRFFKINRMLLDFSNPDRNNNADRLRIGVSHAPIVIAGGPLLRSLINDVDPHVIFSGHWHESRIFYYPSTKVLNFYENEVRHFDLRALKQQHTYLEIMVPTASYRMGKMKIGLGFGVLENYNLDYTVLWCPNRFIYLFIYIFWLIFAGCMLIVMRIIMPGCPLRFMKRQKPHRYSTLPQI